MTEESVIGRLDFKTEDEFFYGIYDDGEEGHPPVKIAAIRTSLLENETDAENFMDFVGNLLSNLMTRQIGEPPRVTILEKELDTHEH